MLGQIGKLVEREFTLLDKIQMQIETLKAKEELEKKGQELEKAVADLSAEKQNSEFLLTNIFPGNVANELRANGKVKAVGHEKATVMFSDFSDFTSVAASYNPAELVEELNRAFCLFDGLSARYGVVGVKRMAYDIWGDTVNIAARIQQGSEPGRINLSKDFRDLMGDRIEVEARGKKPIKNQGEIEMFFLQKVK
jgi:class 3 adenylate cyclase